MTHFSVQQRGQIFVKGYGFLSFTKNMGKHIGKIICKSLRSKCRQKRLDHSKKSAKDAINTVSYPCILVQRKNIKIWQWFVLS